MNETPQRGHKPFFRAPMFNVDAAFGRVWRRLAACFGSMTLKTRVVVLVVAMFVASIWGLAFSITLALERDLTQMLSANVAAEANNVAVDLDRDVRLYTDVLTRLAASLRPETLADPVRLDHALDEFADTSAIVPHACFFANRKGFITAGYPARAVAIGASVEDRDYFREVLASGKPVIGAPVRAATAQQQPLLPIAVPVRDRSGAMVGALVGTVLLSDPLLFGQLENTKIGRSGWFIVIAPKDRLIVAATDHNRVMTSLPKRGVIPLLDRRLDEGYEAPAITRASIGPEVLTATRKMATTGWVVNAAVPAEEIFAPVASLKRGIYLAALLISLSVALILRFFLMRQLAPLAQAGGAMRRMTDGEIPLAPIPVARPDEIGELIGNFNRLVAERRRLDESLQTEIMLRKQVNEALRESRDRVEGIYQSVGDGIISVDAEQRIVLFNAAAERIFGYPAAEMIGESVDMLLPERYRARHAGHIRDYANKGQSMRAMGTYGLVYGQRANGEEFPVEAAVSMSGSGSSKLLTVILRDITARRQAEQVREQLTRQLESLTERLAMAQEDERGKIAYELHEELGQELTTLKLYLQMLAPGSRGTDAADPHKEALAMAVHATERVRKLVLDLEPPELTQFGLHAAVRTYCERQTEAGGWKLHLDAAKPGARAPRSVERACFRLLQEGLGNVLMHAQASEVWVRLRQDADLVELCIRDNGVGFDSRGAIETNSGDGGSLGLFGMQIRAKQAGGSVQIKSAPGAGTEVLAVFLLQGASAKPD